MSCLLKRQPSIPSAKLANLDEPAAIELIEDDGEPLESDWHVKAMCS
jgi:hypothetical protein